ARCVKWAVPCLARRALRAAPAWDLSAPQVRTRCGCLGEMRGDSARVREPKAPVDCGARGEDLLCAPECGERQPIAARAARLRPAGAKATCAPVRSPVASSSTGR